jgi:NADP-dependent 3-hydroxy acid dehydrogenase YdfG
MAVFITGASSGIGEACAWAFAAAGRNLILVARRRDKLTQIAAEIARAHGVSVQVFELDVRKREAVEALWSAHRELLSSVDVLVNNAGMARGREKIQEEKPEDWDEMIQTNIQGLLYVSRTFLPGFVERQRGHLVNIGSVAGHWTYPNGAVYAATKHAVRALTEAMRLDLSGTGVRVTEISPGMVETDFSRVRFRGDETRARTVYQGMTPLRPQDVAEAVVWAVERPAHVNVQELFLYPTDQASTTMVHRRSE